MNWEPLASSDPFPGDAQTVTALAGDQATIASLLDNQAASLERYVSGDSDWTGAARDAFVRVSSELPGRLRTVAERYQTCADALYPFASSLQSVQADARVLLAQAQHAQDEIDRGKSGVQQMDQHARAEHNRLANADPADTTIRPNPWSGPNYHEVLAAGQRALDDARRALDRLRDEFRSDARRAEDAIRDAAKILADDHSVLGRLKQAKDYVVRSAQWVSDHAEEIAKILDIASAVLGLLALIPGLQVLGVVALILSVLSLGLKALLVHQGKMSWGEFGVEVALTALSALTLGGGHLLKSAAEVKQGASVLESANSLAATGRATSGPGATLLRTAAAQGSMKGLKFVGVSKAGKITSFTGAVAKNMAVAEKTEALAAAAAHTAKFQHLAELSARYGAGKRLFDAVGAVSDSSSLYRSRGDIIDFAKVLKNIPVVHLPPMPKLPAAAQGG